MSARHAPDQTCGQCAPSSTAFRPANFHVPRSVPWLGPGEPPDFSLVDECTGLEYWPNADDLAAREEQEEREALHRRIQQLEVQTASGTMSTKDKLTAARRLIAEVEQEVGPSLARLEQITALAAGDRT